MTIQREITLPSFGSSVGEATLVRWMIEPGSAVTAGDVIAEIETDKAMADLEAPESGIIESILVAEGSEGVEVGTVLAVFQADGSDDAGESTDTGATTLQDRQAAEATSTVPAAGEASAASGFTGARVIASPHARKLAREGGIDLSAVAGSGPWGRIVSRDLTGAGKRQVANTAISGDAALAEMGFRAGEFELTAPSRMRRAIAESLTQSIREIPHYALTAEFDFEHALAQREAINGAQASGSATVSINDLVVWACARALHDLPAANCSWTDGGIVQHRHANVAVAVAVDDGLVTPVLRRAERLSPLDIATATRDAIRRARAGQLKTSELQAATFTVSNLGMFGVQSFTSILSRPQACILSVGAVEPRPVVRNGELAIARVATVTLSCDHRVVDGALGARLLQKIGERLGAVIA